MKNLEDLIVDKIYDLTNYVLSKVIHPDIEIHNVTQLDKKAILELKEKHGIEGVILDVDKTLRKDMKKIPKCNEKWIDDLKSQLKVIIVSNGMDKNIEQFFKEKEIDYIGFAYKPLRKNFLKACGKMGVHPSKVLVVGDRLFDDIYGGKRNDMKTAIVKDVKDGER